MAPKDAEGGKAGRAKDDALGELLLAPAAILEGLPDAVVAAARDGRIVYVNALAEALFGYPREELIGRAGADAVAGAHPRALHAQHASCTSRPSTRCGSRPRSGACAATGPSSSAR